MGFTVAMDIYEVRRARLRQLIDQDFNGKAARLAMAIGRQASYVSRLLADSASRHRKNMGEELAREIEQECGKPRGWLDVAEDATDIRGSGVSVGEAPTAFRIGSANAHQLPLIALDNLGTLINEDKRPEPISEDRWSVDSIIIGQDTYAVRVTGNKLEPRFPEGTVLLVEPRRKAEADQFVVVWGKSECSIKQLLRDGQDWYLKSLNDRLPVKPLTPEMDILGVVRGAYLNLI